MVGRGDGGAADTPAYVVELVGLVGRWWGCRHIDRVPNMGGAGQASASARPHVACVVDTTPNAECGVHAASLTWQVRFARLERGDRDLYDFRPRCGIAWREWLCASAGEDPNRRRRLSW